MSNDKNVIVLPYYEDNEGNIFNIKNIVYPTNNPPYDFGKHICSSHDEDCNSFSDDEYGMDVYQSRVNPTVGYRIYRGLMLFLDNFYCYSGVSDAKIVEELQKRQSTIKLTKFPTGVVSINKYVIGQEMAFYENSETIRSFAINQKDNPNKTKREHSLAKKARMCYIKSVEFFSGILICQVCNKFGERGDTMDSSKEKQSFSSLSQLSNKSLYTCARARQTFVSSGARLNAAKKSSKITWAPDIDGGTHGPLSG